MWISTSVASMSKTTGEVASPSARCAHTCSRTAACPAHRPSTVAGPNARTVRYNVGADATSPNKPASARRYSISLSEGQFRGRAAPQTPNP